MRKNALTICCFTCGAGAIGAFCRWLQDQIAFDDSGMSVSSGWNYLMPIIILAAAVCFYFLVRRHKKSALEAPTDFGDAFHSEMRFYIPAAWIVGGLMAVGSVILLVTSGDEASPMMLRILAVLGIFTGVFFPMAATAAKNRSNSPTVCLYMTLPIVLFCLWLVATYKQNSTNPTLWAYAVEILANCASLLAFYYLAGYPYGRAKPYRALYFSMLGAFLCIVCLADDRNLGQQMMVVASACIQLFSCWMIVTNLRTPAPPEAPQRVEPTTISDTDLGTIIQEVKNQSED